MKNKLSFLKKYFINFINSKKTQNFKKTSRILIPVMFNAFKYYKFTNKYLELLCKHYNITKSGTKQTKLTNLYNFLRLKNAIKKIESCVYNHIYSLNNNIKPVNDIDFSTFDKLSDIPKNRLFIYKDKDGFSYGFDIESLVDLFKKTDPPYINPFTNNKFSDKVIYSITNHKIYKQYIDNDDMDIEHKTIEIFHKIRLLGNYPDYLWFWHLNSTKIRKFLFELKDIWDYRANLAFYKKIAICPPDGAPFKYLAKLNDTSTLDKLRSVTLDIIDKFISTGVDNGEKYLGSQYVLSALTLVSDEAAFAMPILYQNILY